uniref:Uncharacterized protein n=1 Tax=Cucumis melo TaxID=3656 RepID=A0A9I9DF73_CUCME
MANDWAIHEWRWKTTAIYAHGSFMTACDLEIDEWLDKDDWRWRFRLMVKRTEEMFWKRVVARVEQRKKKGRR